MQSTRRTRVGNQICQSSIASPQQSRAIVVFWSIAALLLLLTLGSWALPLGSAGQIIVLKNVRIIDGHSSAPIENGVILIDGDRIQAAGPSDKVPLPESARVIDYTGKTALPGLISDHSHVGLIDGVTFSPKNYNQDNILRQLRQYEVYGVTSVTALGGNGDLFYTLQPQLHQGVLPGADLFGADRGIGIPNGAPPSPPFSLPETQLYRVTAPEQAIQAVDEMAARKPTFIKIWDDDFHGTLKEKMQPDIYNAVIAESHKRGMRVAAHIYYLQDAKDLVNSGVDVIAHGVRDVPVDAEFIQAMKRRSVWYIPTIQLDESGYIFAEHPAWIDEPFFQRALQPALRSQVDDPAWRAKILSNKNSVDIAKASVATNQHNVKTLHDAGVKIGFGSDSGATALRVPGFAEHRELELLVDAGLTPLEAIDLATANAAQLLGLDDRGILGTGKLADIVIVDGNPAANIRDIHKIVAVWHRGKLVGEGPQNFTP
jgi:imidazolonepropionase-like amidohydrolase